MENYLFICVRNQILKYKKDQISLLSVSIDEKETLSIENPNDFLKDLERKELSHTLEMAINTLPERCRLIFVLIKEEGFKYREVAHALSISEKTVQAQMVIALKKIGEILRCARHEEEERIKSKLQ